MQRKRVLASGVFEIIHPGHLFYLKQAKKLGTELVVVVATDETVRRYRHRDPIIPEDNRVVVISALKFVDKAVLGDEDDMFETVRKVKPDVIALGPDQDFDEKDLQRELKKRNLKGKVVRIKERKIGTLFSVTEISKRIRSL